MSKNKLAKFAAMETFAHVVQAPAHEILQQGKFSLCGQWNSRFFQNENPIVLELGCGKGEYTVEMALRSPQCNFIGVDIKGARMYSGAKQAQELGLHNVAFLRTNIELIDRFFAENEIAEIWLTFPDPQMKKTGKRLSATNFIRRYQRFLRPEGLIHLKTDSAFLFRYTQEMIRSNNFPSPVQTADLYAAPLPLPVLEVKTFYERQWLARGIAIIYLCFCPQKREHLIEPTVEIEKDSYRSFGRNANA